MTQVQLERRRQQAAIETLVISQTDDGFRVYSPAAPTRTYLVGGSPEEPTCTCPDYRFNSRNGPWRCKHILAVLRETGSPAGNATEPDPVAIEERQAIQEEARTAERVDAPKPPNGASHMLLKRSVSPDGRIDSLSVEFSCPVDGALVREIKTRAMKTLKLQADIVEGFLEENGREPARQGPAKAAEQQAVPADMIDIGGMNTRWGRRLFINVKADGKTLKLFGSEKQLAEAIAAAGYPDRSDIVDEGVNLMLPCRVITKPSDDGKYVNIERVLPAAAPKPARRAR